MRNQDLGLRQRPEGFDERPARRGIQVGGRLVEEQDFGFDRQHPGEGSATALPGTQVVRRTVALAIQTHLLQAAVHPGAHRLSIESHVQRAEGDILLDRRHEDLIVGILEEHADPLPHLRDVRSVDAEPAHADRSLPVQQPDEVVEEGGLAGAVRAEDRDRLGGLQDEVHAAQRLHAIRITEAQAPHVD